LLSHRSDFVPDLLLSRTPPESQPRFIVWRSLKACAPGDAGVDAHMQACLDKNTENLETKVGAAKYASTVGIIDGACATAANNA